MSKRDFEAIARILKDKRRHAIVHGEAPTLVSNVAVGLADYFTDTNPRFDRVKFLQAAGL